MKQTHRSERARRVTILSLVADFFLAILKVVVGAFTGSTGLLADGANSGADVAGGLVQLWAWRLVALPADHNHRYGHGKIETLSAASLGLVMTLVALGLVRESGAKLWNWLGGVLPETPGLAAAWIALAVAAVKVLLALMTSKAARETRSELLAAKAADHRSDVLSALGVALAVFLSPFGRWGALCDPLAGLLVACLLGKTGVSTLWAACCELSEKVDPAVIRQAIAIARSGDGVLDCHAMRARQIGAYWAFDFHITFDDSTTLWKAHQTAEEVTARLKEVFGSETLVTVHQEPHSERADD